MNNLLTLTPRQKELLQRRIRKWNGLVRIFVHPLFEKWNWKYLGGQYDKHPDYGKLINIEVGLSRLLALPYHKAPPIIIMEENAFVDWSVVWVNSRQSSRQARAYYIRTWKNDPTPQIVTRENHHPSVVWDHLTKQFMCLGVKRILIGGMQFDVSTYKTDWTGKYPWVGRCVGIALSYLSKDKAGKFEVDISALVDSSYSRKIYIQCVNETRLKSIDQTTVCT